MSKQKKIEKQIAKFESGLDAFSVEVDAVVSCLDAPTLEEAIDTSISGYPRVKFKDGRWDNYNLILVGEAITTMEKFNNFTHSLAHIFSEDGRILCYGEHIGDFEDLIITMPNN